MRLSLRSCLLEQEGMGVDLADQGNDLRFHLGFKCPEHDVPLVKKPNRQGGSFRGNFLGCPFFKEDGCDFTVRTREPYTASGEMAKKHGLNNVDMYDMIEEFPNPGFSDRSVKIKQTKTHKKKAKEDLESFLLDKLAVSMDVGSHDATRLADWASSKFKVKITPLQVHRELTRLRDILGRP